MSAQSNSTWDVRGRLLFRGFLAFLGTGILFALLGVGWSKVGVALCLAVGSLAAGTFFGFLFGVPRVRANDLTSGKGDDVPRAASNTNLEQISNWLTAIIIGASLVQLREIGSGLDWLSGRFAQGLATGVGAPIPPHGYPVAYFLIVYFFVGGFLFTFLFTRIFLPKMFSDVENDLLLKFRDRLAEVEKKADDAIGAADSAELRLDQIETSEETNENALPEVRRENSESGMNLENPLAGNWKEDAQRLVIEYNALRQRMSASGERTFEMGKIFSRMRALSRTFHDPEITSYLSHADSGWRLMAYSYFYTKPDFNALDSLVKSVADRQDGKLFSEYWGIRAIQRCLIPDDGQEVPIELRNQLRDFRNRLAKGSDRRREMDKVMDRLAEML